MECLKCRQARILDVSRIAEIELKSLSTPWSVESIEYEIDSNPFSTYLVIEVDSLVIGHIGFWNIANECNVNNVAIDPDYRGKGLGKRLISYLLDFGKENNIEAYTLEVRKSNHIAIKLYKGFGFKECGIRKSFYEDTGEDAIIMWKNIKEEY